MRSAICTQIYWWKNKQAKAAKQAAAGTAQGHHGVEGWRGHKKPLTTKSGKGFLSPDTFAKQ
jgi:hypothetical protein